MTDSGMGPFFFVYYGSAVESESGKAYTDKPSLWNCEGRFDLRQTYDILDNGHLLVF